MGNNLGRLLITLILATAVTVGLLSVCTGPGASAQVSFEPQAFLPIVAVQHRIDPNPEGTPTSAPTPPFNPGPTPAPTPGPVKPPQVDSIQVLTGRGE